LNLKFTRSANLLRNELAAILGMLLLMGIVVLLHIQLHQYSYDDAYIHFRVARNLVDFGVPYYNPLEILKVSTSSGWVIFLALIYWLAKAIHLVGHFALIISIINALITIGVVFIYTRIVEIFLQRQLTLPQKLLFQTTILALLLLPSIGLMETSLALLLAGAGIFLLLKTKSVGFLLLAMSLYFRMELILLASLLCALAIFRGEFKLQKTILWFTAGILPFIIFDLYFFRTIIPQSVLAKSVVYSITPFQTFIEVLNRSLPGFPAANFPKLIVRATFLLLPIVVLSWVTIREKDLIKRSYYPAALGVSALLVLASYVGKHVLLFEWYTPLYMLPLVTSLFSYAYLVPPPRNFVLKIPLFTLFLFSGFFLVSSMHAIHSRPDDFVLFESGARVKMYLYVGDILNQEYPEANLLTSEIGGLGYSFKGKILDGAGLASRDALTFHPMAIPVQRSSGTSGAIPYEFVIASEPDIIVSYDIFAEELLSKDVSAEYHLITLPAYLPEDIQYSKNGFLWGSKFLRVYMHKSLPLSANLCKFALATSQTLNPACKKYVQ